MFIDANDHRYPFVTTGQCDECVCLESVGLTPPSPEGQSENKCSKRTGKEPEKDAWCEIEDAHSSPYEPSCFSAESQIWMRNKWIVLNLISKYVSSPQNFNVNDDVTTVVEIDSRFVRGYSKDPYHRFSHLAPRFVYRRPRSRGYARVHSWRLVPLRRGARSGGERPRDWKRRMVDKYGQDGFYVHFPLPGTHAWRGVTRAREKECVALNGFSRLNLSRALHDRAIPSARARARA